MENTNNQTSTNGNGKEKSGFLESLKVVLAYLHDLVCLIAVVMLLFSFCFRVVVVSGDSMNNSLHDGDCLLVLGRVFYSDPKPGDVVVISKDSFDDGEPIIKRVIATEGQTVDIRDGLVFVDDKPLTESYALQPTRYDEIHDLQFPLVVDKGCVFVLGDNRGNSTDSRSVRIGIVDQREILGKAVFLFFPGKVANSRDFSKIGGIAS